MRDLYFAACAPDGGVYHYQMEDGNFIFIRKYDLDRPKFLAIENDRLYVILREVIENESGVLSFRIEPDGSLADMTMPVSARGACACHLCVDHGNVYTANYLSGTVSHVGYITVAHTGKGPNAARQEGPHCHYVGLTANGRYLLCCDLGNDTIYTYDKQLREVSRAQVPAGEGCRHLVMSKKRRLVYCVNELGSSVTVFRISDGVLTPCGTFGALPEHPKTPTKAAAIRLSEDEKFLYVSNRGDDSICTFAVSDDGETLTQASFTPVGGSSPRDVDLVDGYLLCTNEFTNNVTVFRVSGAQLTKEPTELPMPNPLCVVYR